MDPSEERLIAVALYEGTSALNVISEYLLIEITNIDKQLDNVIELYEGEGNRSLLVAAVLARRSAFNKLHRLINEKIELDDDQSKE